MSTWLTTFLIRSHGMPIGQAGLMVAIAYGVLGSVGGFAAGWIADWFNKRRGGFEPSRTALFRSEEHTSELQSLMRISYAVFCLKKKNQRSIEQSKTTQVDAITISVRSADKPTRL